MTYIFVFCALTFLWLNCYCQQLPIFKYVTTYNKAGRVMREEDIEKTSVNVLKPITFIVGAPSSADVQYDSWSKELEDAYTDKYIHNVFVVTLPPQPSKDKAEDVAKKFADFVLTIYRQTGESYLDIHMVFLKGGIAPYVSEKIQQEKGQKVKRVTIIDPSSDLTEKEINILKNSAEFIDVIHNVSPNDTQELKPFGQIDFYVIGECDENCLLKLFAKSVSSRDISGVKCDSLQTFKTNQCTGKEEVIFGQNVNKSSSGKYFLKIN